MDELKKECGSMKLAKESAEKATENAKALVQQLNKQLSQHRELVNKQKQTMAKMASDKESAVASSKLSSEASKERDQLREQIKKLASNEMSTKTELEGANTRIEKLKNHLRTYQKKMGELQKKLQQSESDLNASKAALKAARAAPALESNSSASAPKAFEMTETTLPAAAALDATKTAPKETAKEPQKAEPAKEPEKAETAKKPQKAESAKEPQKAEREVEAPPTVPPGGFRYGPGGSLQPPPGQVPRKRKATSSPPRKELEEHQDDGSQKAVLKKAKSSPKEITAKNSLTAKPTDAAAAPKPEPKAATPAKPDGDKKEEDDLRAKLLKRKRELEASLKKADGEKDQKRAAIAKEEASGGEQVPAEEKAEETSGKEAAPAPAISNDLEETLAPELKEAPAVVAVPAVAKALFEGEVQEPENVEEEVAVVDSERDVSTSVAAEVAPTEAKQDIKAAVEPKETEPAKPDKPKTSLFGKPSTFGSGNPFGSGGTFGMPAAPLAFGSSSTLAKKETDLGESSPKPTSGDEPPAFGGGAFLNMKPPGSTKAPKFTFGSSSSITLPTPAKGLPAASATTFGVFGQGPGGASPFGGGMSQAQPLFGAPSSMKPAAVYDESGEAEEDEKYIDEEGGNDEGVDLPESEEDADRDEDAEE